MTERKPSELSFRSWIDQQIDDAARRGAFENLPGTGKPLPDRGPNADEAWLMDWVRREGLSTEEMLPTPLKLRKQSARLAESVHKLRSEDDVREIVGELNERIMSWRRLPIGPPIFVPLVDEEEMLARWRAARTQVAPEQAAPPVAGAVTASRRRRWRRR
jgi:hypothetical protein